MSLIKPYQCGFMTKNKLYFVTIILSACSIIYELLLATMLSQITGSYVWWHSWTISLYILGLGIGSYKANNEEPKNLVKLEIKLATLGLFTPIFLLIVHGILLVYDSWIYVNHQNIYHSYNFFFKSLFFIIAQSLVFYIGLLSGREIPLILKQIDPSDENKVIGYNYFGTLIGTLLFSFGLQPYFDIQIIAIIISAINFSIALILSKTYFQKVSKKLILFVLLIPLFFPVVSKLDSYYNKVKYHYSAFTFLNEDKSISAFFKSKADFPEVKSLRTLYQNVDIVQSHKDETITMYLDGHYQFSTKTEKYYHEGFVHIPILLKKNMPKNVLVLGAGDGMLIRELIKYDEIKEIRHIELDGELNEMFKTGNYKNLNSGSLSHPKVKTEIGDGFYFVRNTREKFDAIFIDFPYPKSYDLSRLYSIEFYKNIYHLLNDNGFVILDAPIVDRLPMSDKYGNDETHVTASSLINNSVLMSTIHYSGFKGVFPYRIIDESFILITKNQDKINFQLSEDFFIKAPNIKEDDILKIKNQTFPFEIGHKYINSIFFPKLVDQWTLSPMIWFD